ncbi:TetR/AcrR family transcriptional regulator [Novosphingobium piscinae]|uniref:TetR/AcrR family transcriptional regulator n=1 Tax=Novosphingobium piscinae TaxID=1507448 RepID=A0A7X1FZF3_9SPHN|nr:TetR/AcrR family transcriptional regulator [Novosphingobium piscinae]MBC2669816.1 TetR/AcrR family transcriptional regulator [Novosphingobium piscinae]
MTTKATVRERRGQPSHREDLRGELLAAAVRYVLREGHESLSMRRLAEEVGVSPGAPYHHFPDRRALLVAVALEGYRAMFAQNSAGADADDDPRAALTSAFLNFIRFAAANPTLFTLMYESELVRPVLAPELAEAQAEGYQLMRRLIGRIATGISDTERAVRIATIWSAIFGYALQCNRSMLRAYPAEPPPDELAPQVVQQALRLLA